MQIVDLQDLKQKIKKLRRNQPMEFGEKITLPVNTLKAVYYDQAIEDVLDVIDKLPVL